MPPPFGPGVVVLLAARTNYMATDIVGYCRISPRERQGRPPSEGATLRPAVPLPLPRMPLPWASYAGGAATIIDSASQSKGSLKRKRPYRVGVTWTRLGPGTVVVGLPSLSQNGQPKANPVQIGCIGPHPGLRA